MMLLLFIVNGLISLLLLNTLRTTQQQQQLINTELGRLQNYEVAFRGELSVYSEIIFVSKVTSIRNPYTNAILDSLDSTDHTNPDPQVQKLAQLYLVAHDHFQAMEQAIRAGDFESAGKIWSTAKPDFDSVPSFLAQWRQELETRFQKGETDLSNTFMVSYFITAGLTILSIAMVILFLILIQKALLNPLLELKAGLQRIAQGDLDQQLHVPNRDELGVLAQSFSQALSSLQKVIRGVKVMEELQQLAQRLAVVSGQQASGTAQQVSALTQIIAAIEELGHTATMISLGANQVGQVVYTTTSYIENLTSLGSHNQQQVEEVVRVVENTVNGIERVKDQVQTTNQKMSEFSEQARQIIQIVELLRALSGEVHILSLNAAIEAASAGAYGERFKAVAGAIRALANKASAATQHANRLISEMQLGSEIVANQMELSESEVSLLAEENHNLRQVLNQMQQSARQVGEAVLELQTQVEVVNNQAELIKNSTYQQQLSNEQIISSVHLVKEVADETSSMAGTVAAHSGQLERLALQLGNVLNHIKLAI
jgi:methyl-accepting chemotaxis protein